MTSPLPAALPLTPGRRIVLAAGVPLVLLIIGWSAVNAVAWLGQGSYPVRLSLPARGAAASFSTDAGTTTVRPAAGGRLGVTGTAHYALWRSRVTWRSAPSGISVLSQCRQLTGPCSFDYTVTVPRGLRIRLANDSGDVIVQGLTGPVSVADNSGNVRLESLPGALDLHADSGDITGTGLASRSVLAESNSGDITLTFTRVPRHIRVSADSGNIRVVLPPGAAGYRVAATTGSGTVSVSVPVDSRSPDTISASTNSGDITITR
jgi:Toastrack DUF4097